MKDEIVNKIASAIININQHEFDGPTYRLRETIVKLGAKLNNIEDILSEIENKLHSIGYDGYIGKHRFEFKLIKL